MEASPHLSQSLVHLQPRAQAHLPRGGAFDERVGVLRRQRAEQRLAGGEGVPPMLPGGIRRVIIPSNPDSNLAYADLAKPNKNNLQVQDCSSGRGPVPPNTPTSANDMGAGEFQRFKNIYCNANRPYQPDLVLDIKLFGKRS